MYVYIQRCLCNYRKQYTYLMYGYIIFEFIHIHIRTVIHTYNHIYLYVHLSA